MCDQQVKDMPDTNMKHYTGNLTIRLKSDLCAGTGMAYAGIIDSDVSFDSSGIPQIPGRRLKGCMRESASLLGYTEAQKEAIFGSAGQPEASRLHIGNARPAGYDDLAQLIVLLSSADDQNYVEKPYLTRESILALYTAVRAQTKIADETGVADDTTLRFTRVVNHYDFFSEEEEVFTAKIAFTGTQEEWEAVKNSARATRNIGQNRNRGLGSVCMSVEETGQAPSEAGADPEPQDAICGNFDPEARWHRITYHIKNVSPLVISGNNETSSRNLINGGSLVGLLAAEYLRTGKAEDDEFSALFLRGEALFSDLLMAKPCKDTQGNTTWIDFEPAPAWLSRLKKAKKLVNLAAEQQWNPSGEMNTDYDPGRGNLPKKLDGHFVSWKADGSCCVSEPGRQLTYHHSHHGKNADGEEGLLYSSQALEAGQYFFGEILVKTQYAKIAYKLLTQASLRFGKSSTVEYGECRLAEPPVLKPAKDTVPVPGGPVPKGSRIIVTFLSHGAFLSEKDDAKAGSYTVAEEDIRYALTKAFKKNGIELETAQGDGAWMRACEITGYSRIWNLKKQAFPAIAMGSALSFTLKSGMAEYPLYVGEKKLEGFGRIRAEALSAFSYIVPEWKPSVNDNDAYASLRESPIVKKAFQKALISHLQNELKGKAYVGEKIGISASALGRLTSMLREACLEYPGDVWEQYVSLRMRIESIKSEAARTQVLKYLQKILGSDYIKSVSRNTEEDERAYIRRAADENKVKQIRSLCARMKALAAGPAELICREFPENSEKLLLEAALEYLHDALVYQKYLGKEDTQ